MWCLTPALLLCLSAPSLAAKAMELGLECGYISWFDFHMLMRKGTAVNGRQSAGSGQGKNSGQVAAGRGRRK